MSTHDPSVPQLMRDYPRGPTGTCDAGCGRPAQAWFGDSSAASCGAPQCVQKLRARWEAHYARVSAELSGEGTDEY